MSQSYIWYIIFGLSIMVLAMRWSFLVLPRRFQPKGALAQALGFAPLAALVAICVPEVLKAQMQWYATQGSLEFNKALPSLLSDWRLWGGLAMLIISMLFRQSKSAALYGLIAAATVVFLID
jgi:branched-subunit amino acid transport protein